MTKKESLRSFDQLKFGKWTKDEVGLPCFDLNLENNPVPYYPFSHLMSTGHINVLANQWGNINLLTTEGGTISLTPNTCRTRSGLYCMVSVENELYSLIFSELNHRKTIRYGTGYVEYSGELKAGDMHLHISQVILVPPDKKCGFICRFTVKNLSKSVLRADFSIQSDVFPCPGCSNEEFLSKQHGDTGSGYSIMANVNETLGSVILIGDSSWNGLVNGHTLGLNRFVTIESQGEIDVGVFLGYGKCYDIGVIQRYISEKTRDDVLGLWNKKLSNIKVNADEEWAIDECIWSMGQLYSFINYDNSLDEYYINLGGYGYLPDPDHPMYWGTFNVREDSGTAIVMAYWDNELAQSSLRWVAKTQLGNGDIPKAHNCRHDRDIQNMGFESDNEVWFVLGCCEYVRTTGDFSFYCEEVPFWEDESFSIWEHLKRAFYWVKDGIGTGSHGLILIKDGDWNDYLSKVGSGGKGESVMNSGMACRAFSILAQHARVRGDTVFALEIEGWIEVLRDSVASAFDKDWFLCAYTDKGRPVGSYSEDRVYINAQSWAALGGCGSKEQRRKALMNAVEKCHTEIGMVLINKPYSSPPPDYISWCPIPAGEGENAGIWPQTVYWMVWALAEEGLVDIALNEWKCMSMRNHSHLFPDVPFGIYNGPDCYSSKYAGSREGWTQVQVLNRMIPLPMNPIIAWQAFAMKKINEASDRLNA